MPERTVSEDLFHVKNRILNPVQNLRYLNSLTKLSWAKFWVTSLIDFRPYISAFGNFMIYEPKLMAQYFDVNLNNHYF